MLRLDNLVGILEMGIREADKYSNRYDDLRGLYNYLKTMAEEQNAQVVKLADTPA